MGYGYALENVFDPEMTTDKLLDLVRQNVQSKITTVDQAAELENQLSEEAAEFNNMLRTISNAMSECKAGNISREEMLRVSAPCIKALKTNCKALSLVDVEMGEDDISENEIAMLREYIVGCKDIVAQHKESLQDCSVTQNAQEGITMSRSDYQLYTALEAAYQNYMMEDALEAAMEAIGDGEASKGNFLTRAIKKVFGSKTQEELEENQAALKKETDDAVETAKKKGLKPWMKAAIAIGGALLVAAGIAVGGQFAAKNLQKNGKNADDSNVVVRALIRLSAIICKLPLKAIQKAQGVHVKLQEKQADKYYANGVTGKKAARFNASVDRLDNRIEKTNNLYNSIRDVSSVLKKNAADNANGAAVNEATTLNNALLMYAMALEEANAADDFDFDDVDELYGRGFDGEGQGTDIVDTADEGLLASLLNM